MLLDKLSHSDSKVDECQKQLQALLAGTKELRTESDYAAQCSETLKKENAELSVALERSTDQIKSLKNESAECSRLLTAVLLDIGPKIGVQESRLSYGDTTTSNDTKSLVQITRTATQMIVELMQRSTMMAEEVEVVTKTSDNQNERLLMLNDQVNDWKINAIELRSTNIELFEKLKEEEGNTQERSTQLKQTLSKTFALCLQNVRLVNEKSKIEEDRTKLAEANERLQSQLDNIDETAAEQLQSLVALLDKISLTPTNCDEQTPNSSCCIENTPNEVVDGSNIQTLLRNVMLLGREVELISEAKIAAEAEANDMKEIINGKGNLIAELEAKMCVMHNDRVVELEELRALLRDRDISVAECGTLLKVVVAENSNLHLDVERVLKENNALEREVLELSAMYERSKACIESQENLSVDRAQSLALVLAKIGSDSSVQDAMSSSQEDEMLLEKAFVSIASMNGTSKTILIEDRLEETRNETRGMSRTFSHQIGQSKEAYLQSLAATNCDGVQVTEGTVTDWNQLNEALVSTLRFENKLLKIAINRKDADSAHTQQLLRDENRSLKKSIGRLTRQTTDHQRRIRQLAQRQSDLTRRQEDWICSKCQVRESAGKQQRVDVVLSPIEGAQTVNSTATELWKGNRPTAAEVRDDLLPTR